MYTIDVLTITEDVFVLVSLESLSRSCPTRQAHSRRVMADLDSLTETEVEQDGKRFLMRSAPRPGALALSALGVALPPTMRQVAGA